MYVCINVFVHWIWCLTFIMAAWMSLKFEQMTNVQCLIYTNRLYSTVLRVAVVELM